MGLLESASGLWGFYQLGCLADMRVRDCRSRYAPNSITARKE